MKTASVEEQVALGEQFVRGLLAEMGAQATITSEELAEGVVELLITGENLGTLIGPKGATLLALQELTRTVMQRQVSSSECRVVLDINGYRRRRQDALARFARQVALEVQASNTKRALEPMPPPDRKVVHDAVNDIPGVTTISEGEEPYRRVLLVPVSPDAADDNGPRRQWRRTVGELQLVASATRARLTLRRHSARHEPRHRYLRCPALRHHLPGRTLPTRTPKTFVVFSRAPAISAFSGQGMWKTR